VDAQDDRITTLETDAVSRRQLVKFVAWAIGVTLTVLGLGVAIAMVVVSAFHL
jgi:hypothetical protein